jgi:hypothetical protein
LGDAEANVYENNSHTLDELKTAVIKFTQWDFVKVYSNKIELVNACSEEGDISSTLYGDMHLMQYVLCSM